MLCGLLQKALQAREGKEGLSSAGLAGSHLHTLLAEEKVMSGKTPSL